ncbi:hypothetical protein [Anaerotruncus colihominis]|nr:hypothetical protein [Anaerotruncus colihominis]
MVAMLGAALWFAASFGFYRFMMGQCEKAARAGYRAQRRCDTGVRR